MLKLILLTLIPLFMFSVAEAKVKRTYKSGGKAYVQKGYVRKKSGKYVAPHVKTKPDNYKWNNLKQK